MPLAQLPGVNLHYAQVGPRRLRPEGAADVVMIHGLGANVAFWYFGIAPHLAWNHRVTMFDLRGHGRSSMPEQGYSPRCMAEDVCALLDHLGVTQPVHLVTHSYGALVGLDFACRYPDRIRSLVIADVRLRALQPELQLDAWRHWPRYLHLIRQLGLKIDERSNAIGFQILEEVARRRNTQGWDRRALSELVPPAFLGGRRGGAAARWLDLLDRTSAREELLAGDDLTRERLEQLHKPTLALYGELSPMLPTADALQQLWPHARVGTVPGGGLFFPSSKPVALAWPARRFLAGQARARPAPGHMARDAGGVVI